MVITIDQLFELVSAWHVDLFDGLQAVVVGLCARMVLLFGLLLYDRSTE